MLSIIFVNVKYNFSKKFLGLEKFFGFTNENVLRFANENVLGLKKFWGLLM